MGRSPALRILLIAVALATPALAGCVSAPDDTVHLTPYSALVATSPGRDTSWAVYVNNTGAFREDRAASITAAPPGWTASVDPPAINVAGGTGTVLIVRAKAPADAAHGLQRLTLDIGGAQTTLFANVDAAPAKAARAGAGAQVHTVGLWENGTVFYTNWKAVNDTNGIPRGDLGDDFDFKPLKVYLGGKQGQRPPEPYNSSGYFSVIPGFDKGVQGMRPGETKVAHLAPEEAYTRDGREDHALYGDALIFVIHLVSVDELEAETPASGPVPCPLPVCP